MLSPLPTKKLVIRGAKGVTLIELVVALAILSILVVLAAPDLSISSKKAKVQDCAKRLASDITMARANAQTVGQRALIVISKDTARDFAGNGGKENFFAFLDANRNNAYDMAGTPETIVAQDSCDNSIVMVASSTPLPDCTGFGNAQCLSFSTLGTLLNANTTDTSVQMAYNDGANTYQARVIVVSMTGHLETQWSQDGGTTWKDF